jgi:hypothetical protein
MKSELAEKLKDILDNTTQEEFDEVWKEITSKGIESPSMLPNTKSLREVKAVKDYAGEWYVIPTELHEEFYDSCFYEIIGDLKNFDSKWGGYRIGKDLNNIQLYAEI